MLKPKMLKQSKKIIFFRKMMSDKEIIIDQYGVPNFGKNNTQIKKTPKNCNTSTSKCSKEWTSKWKDENLKLHFSS